MSNLNKEIRAWWIEKPVGHNVPAQAVFEQFKPIVSKQGHEWIRVISLDDFHAQAGMNITRWVEVCQHLSKAIKALEFYSDIDNWSESKIRTNGVTVNDKISIHDIYEIEEGNYYGGKLAREVLRQIKGTIN